MNENTDDKSASGQPKLKLIQFKAERGAKRGLSDLGWMDDPSSWKRLGVALAVAAGATVMGLAIALTQRNRVRKKA